MLQYSAQYYIIVSNYTTERDHVCLTCMGILKSDSAKQAIKTARNAYIQGCLPAYIQGTLPILGFHYETMWNPKNYSFSKLVNVKLI